MDAVLSQLLQTSPGDSYLNRACSNIDLDSLAEEPYKRCILCEEGQSWELIWILIDIVGSSLCMMWRTLLSLYLNGVIRIMNSDLYCMVFIYVYFIIHLSINFLLLDDLMHCAIVHHHPWTISFCPADLNFQKSIQI
jgi:hypothetical protein